MEPTELLEAWQAHVGSLSLLEAWERHLHAYRRDRQWRARSVASSKRTRAAKQRGAPGEGGGRVNEDADVDWRFVWHFVRQQEAARRGWVLETSGIPVMILERVFGKRIDTVQPSEALL